MFQRHEIKRGAPDEPVREICRFKNGGSLRRKENSDEGDQQVLSCFEEGKIQRGKRGPCCFTPLSLRLQEICFCTKSPQNVAKMEGKSFPAFLMKAKLQI